MVCTPCIEMPSGNSCGLEDALFQFLNLWIYFIRISFVPRIAKCTNSSTQPALLAWNCALNFTNVELRNLANIKLKFIFRNVGNDKVLFRNLANMLCLEMLPVEEVLVWVKISWGKKEISLSPKPRMFDSNL